MTYRTSDDLSSTTQQLTWLEIVQNTNKEVRYKLRVTQKDSKTPLGMYRLFAPELLSLMKQSIPQYQANCQLQFSSPFYDVCSRVAIAWQISLYIPGIQGFTGAYKLTNRKLAAKESISS